MFNSDFYPTPVNVIEIMLAGVNIQDKNVLEPSAGKGDIVDYLTTYGANVSACEINDDLRAILYNKCRVIAPDFLSLKSDQVSHIDLIVMNPPFSGDEKHILHAYNIAPPGCKIISLCNANTINNSYTTYRRELKTIIEANGSFNELGNVFADAERKTVQTNIGLIIIQKPGGGYDTEFEGFFLDEEPEGPQSNGIMSYNFVRDVVNRYIAAVKLYDEQIAIGIKMNALTESFYKTKVAFTCTQNNVPVLRSEFKKDLQKNAWDFILAKMKLEKYTTKGLRDDLNKFVEKQHQIPFTMKNIYTMLDIIIGTTESRMNQALLEVFDSLTTHYDENRYNVEGWKTNSHYLVNSKFIMPWVVNVGYSGRIDFKHGNRNAETLEDFVKALCYIKGVDYNKMLSFDRRITHEYMIIKNGDVLGDEYYTGFFYPKRFKTQFDADMYVADLIAEGHEASVLPPPEWGQWYDWGFFECKSYKKGTTHFKFKDLDLWGLFNQNIARLKGYPLFEAKK